MSGPASFSLRLGRFASYNVAQQVWLAALSLLATPILYYRMGADAYGLLAVVNVVAAQLAILEFGFGHATIRRLARYRALGDADQISRTLATSGWVFLGTALVGTLIILTATDFLAERYFQIPPEMLHTGKVALRIGAAFFALSVFGNLAGAVFQGIQRFGYLNLAAGATATAQLGGSVVIVMAGFGVVEVLLWSVFLGLVSAMIHVGWLARVEPDVHPWARPDRGAFREMAGFGFLLMLAGIFTQVALAGGPLVLAYFVSVGALPFFTVPFGLYQRLTRMGHGLAAALYPLVAEMDGLDDEPSMRRVFESGTRILLVGGLAATIPGAILATPFLAIWMGPDFAAQGGRVLELLLAAFVLVLATVPSVELARGTGRAGLLVWYTGLVAAFTVIGVLVLAPGLGPQGAGVAFLVAQAVGSGFLLARVGRGWTVTLLGGRLVVFSAVAVAAGLGAILGVDAPGARMAVALLLGGALSWGGVSLVLTEAERTTLGRLGRRP